MTSALILLLVVLLVVYTFEYINGFHDTANAIATVVSTKVLTPRQALLLAASTNLVGAFCGTAVAKTIGSGMVDTNFVSTLTIFCAMLGGIIWNLLTWWFGMPSSSTHALVGGLCGATIASAGGKWDVLIWSKEKIDAKTGAVVGMDGLLHKVIIPMISSPIIGIIAGWLFMGFLFWLIRNWRPRTINSVFSKLQLASAGYMGFGHGLADAQKTMGVIALTLFTATEAGVFEHVPAWMSFLVTPTKDVVPWVKVSCALVMAAGTWAGGWRIIKTLGHKMVKMKPVHGFAAETTAASILVATGAMGMPVSTTHIITTSIMGVGAAKRWNSVRWSLVERIVWAWIMTIPATALLGYVFYRIISALQ
ncbi:inorganic phosphate transporter [Prosthecobacter sp.]|uniref:inorganic phosphate transporter n=1 Tax=Prosthecobacter sp. TaxID=1965333 RepID=UPI001DC2FA88|nr:inorganic phosphate transporter [Prosthecobacter sp.]MCB1275492.1 inorganic phosphate transporter [Prosthecobacter sp.]